MANETILVVGTDSDSQNALDISFKKQGYRVVMTESIRDALAKLEIEAPDLIISDTHLPDGDGMAFCADLKGVSNWKSIPFIFLTEDRSLAQKMRGLDLGADDYLTKPVYIKEVLTRVNLILQKEERKIAEGLDNDEIVGQLLEQDVLDLLQAIERHKQSGSIRLERNGHKAAIYFRDGRILDAICGKLQGEDALYRTMLWSDGHFVIRYHDNIRRIDHIQKDFHHLHQEGLRRRIEWQTISQDLPNFDAVYEIDYGHLSSRAGQMPPEVERIVRLFDGYRKLADVIDDSPIEDIKSLQIIRKLFADNAIHELPGDAATHHETSVADVNSLDAWLSDVSEELGESLPASQDNKNEWDRAEPTNPGLQPLATKLPAVHPADLAAAQAEERLAQDSGVIHGSSVRDEESEAEEQERARQREEARYLSAQTGKFKAVAPFEPTLRKVEAVSRVDDSTRQSSAPLPDDEQEDYTGERTLLAIPAQEILTQPSTPESSSPAIDALTPSASDATLGEPHAKEVVGDSTPIPAAEPPGSQTPTQRRLDAINESDNVKRQASATLRQQTQPSIEAVVVKPEYARTDAPTDDTVLLKPSPETAPLADDEPPVSEQSADNGASAPMKQTLHAFQTSSNLSDAPRTKPETIKIDHRQTDVQEEDDFLYVQPSPYKKPLLIAGAVGAVVIIGLGIFLFTTEEQTDTKLSEGLATAESDTQPEPPSGTDALLEDQAPLAATALADAVHQEARVVSDNLEEVQTVEEESAPEPPVKVAREDHKPAQARPEPPPKPTAAPASGSPPSPASSAAQTSGAQAGDGGVSRQLERVRDLLKREESSQALELARSLSDQAPNNRQVAFLHGLAASYNNANREAIEHFLRAERLGLRTPELYHELGTAYQLVNFRDRAKGAYETFLELEPTGPKADQVREFLKSQF